jgi:hypothetical protein
MHQQLWGYKVEWKSVSRGTGRKKVEYHCLKICRLHPSHFQFLIRTHPIISCINYLNTFTEQSPSWEVIITWLIKKCPTPLILRHSKVHYRVHNSPPLVPILSYMNPVHTFPLYFPKIYSCTTSSHLRLGPPSGLYSSGFLTQILYAFVISAISATCPTHHILLACINYAVE